MGMFTDSPIGRVFVTITSSNADSLRRCGAGPDRIGWVAAAITRHLERVLPTGYRLTVRRHGPGSRAFALDPGLPALRVAEDILGELLGAAPLRVAMGATIPIGDIFARHLGASIVFFSFSTSDEDYHAPNEFLRLSNFRMGMVAWARLLSRLAKG